MAEFETGPKPVNEEVVNRYTTLVANGQILPETGRNFTDNATFSVTDKRSGFVQVFFAPTLLGYNPNESRLRIEDEQVWLSNLEGNLLESLLPSDLRLVDVIRSVYGIVRPSGYVLKNRNYVDIRGKQKTADEMEEVLLNLESGIAPSILYPYPFAKVNTEADKSLIGRRFLLLTLDLRGEDGYIAVDKDVVVIDTQNKKLIGREVVRLRLSAS